MSAVVVFLDLLGGLGVLSMCATLGAVLRMSHVQSDKNWGLGVWAFGLVYASHAAAPVWMWLDGMYGWALGVGLGFVVVSMLGVWVGAAATEAAARP